MVTVNIPSSRTYGKKPTVGVGRDVSLKLIQVYISTSVGGIDKRMKNDPLHPDDPVIWFVTSNFRERHLPTSLNRNEPVCS